MIYSNTEKVLRSVEVNNQSKGIGGFFLFFFIFFKTRHIYMYRDDSTHENEYSIECKEYNSPI